MYLEMMLSHNFFVGGSMGAGSFHGSSDGRQMKTPPATEVADGVLHAFTSEETRHLSFQRALLKTVPGTNILFSRFMGMKITVMCTESSTRT
jgi:hypothetical protein